MILNAALYLGGAMLCIVWRWMRWLASMPSGTPLNSFWRARMPTNVSSLIVSILVMGAYLTGALSAMMRGVLPEGWALPETPMASMAPIAGFLITLSSRVLVNKYLDKIGGGDEDK